MLRGTAAVCVLLVTSPALAQRRSASVHVSSGGGAAMPAPAAHAAPGPVHHTPSMRMSSPGAGPAPHAYLPPPPSRGVPTRARYGVEPVPVLPSFVPGSPLAPRDPAPAPLTGFCGGRHVTYAGGGYYPHVMVYPIGGYYPTYYQSFPWAQEAYDAPELSGLAIDEGYLELHVSPPDAVIAIDGRSAGAGFADGQRLTLPPGYHWVEVARDGFRTEVYNVSIGAGRVYPLRAQLAALAKSAPAEAAPPTPRATPEKGSGTLALKVPVAGARIFIDGESWGAARADAAGFIVLPAGDHSLRVEWPNTRPTISNVHLHDGDRVTLDLSPGE